MRNLVICLIVLGITFQSFSQEKTVKLSEIEITSVNYKYLSDVGSSEAAIPVKILQREVANFDLKNSSYYEDEELDYSVYFEIPEGKILAVYDREGEIIRTSERFKDIHLPLSVSNAVVVAYPGWKIASDIYLVTYQRNKGVKKVYKLLLEKDNKYKRVKTDSNGKFI